MCQLQYLYNQGQTVSRKFVSAGYLGFEEPSAVVPDLRVLPAVGGGAHRGRPGVSGISSDGQVLVLGPVLYPDVHGRLQRGETGI